MVAQLDTLDFSLASYARSERSLSFNASGREEAEAWQRKLRSRLVDLVGGFPGEPCQLSPRVTETVEFPTYTRETVFFQSRPDSTVFGYFLTPKNLRAPAPAVLCLHGHGRGVDDIVGIREDGTMRSRLGGYQKDFALQCVRKRLRRTGHRTARLRSPARRSGPRLRFSLAVVSAGRRRRTAPW